MYRIKKEKIETIIILINTKRKKFTLICLLC